MATLMLLRGRYCLTDKGVLDDKICMTIGIFPSLQVAGETSTLSPKVSFIPAGTSALTTR